VPFLKLLVFRGWRLRNNYCALPPATSQTTQTPLSLTYTPKQQTSKISTHFTLHIPVLRPLKKQRTSHHPSPSKTPAKSLTSRPLPPDERPPLQSPGSHHESTPTPPPSADNYPRLAAQQVSVVAFFSAFSANLDDPPGHQGKRPNLPPVAVDKAGRRDRSLWYFSHSWMSGVSLREVHLWYF